MDARARRALPACSCTRQYRLTLGIHRDGGWASFLVDAPERFTDGRAIDTYARMLEIAHRWNTWGGEQQDAWERGERPVLTS